METKVINPWTWQDNLGFSQAVEVKNNQGTLYCAGQTAMSAEGAPVNGTMTEQVALALQNLEQVITQAGYKPSNIVRLNVYTTSIPEYFEAYGAYMGWIMQHGVVPACTLLGVSALAFPELKVEIEATVVG